MVVPLDIAAVEISGRPVLASDAEVDEMEARLGVTLPIGYREYVTRLGEGILNDFVQVLPPWRILAELETYRGMTAASWFWDAGTVPFGQQQAMESIQVADTMDGDLIVFHPADGGRLVILPRFRDRHYVRGPDLLEVIGWVCGAGVIRRMRPGRFFEPFDSRIGAADRAGDEATPPATPSNDLPPPTLNGSPTDVLLAYFAELHELEVWWLAKMGGAEAVLSRDLDVDDVDDLGDDGEEMAILEELQGRTAAVHVRYCTPRLARALRGSVSVGIPFNYARNGIRVLDATEEHPGRVVIRTAGGSASVLHRYVLEQADNEWRVSAQSDLGFDPE